MVHLAVNEVLGVRRWTAVLPTWRCSRSCPSFHTLSPVGRSSEAAGDTAGVGSSTWRSSNSDLSEDDREPPRSHGPSRLGGRPSRGDRRRERRPAPRLRREVRRNLPPRTSADLRADERGGARGSGHVPVRRNDRRRGRNGQYWASRGCRAPLGEQGAKADVRHRWHRLGSRGRALHRGLRPAQRVRLRGDLRGARQRRLVPAAPDHDRRGPVRRSGGTHPLQLVPGGLWLDGERFFYANPHEVTSE